MESVDITFSYRREAGGSEDGGGALTLLGKLTERWRRGILPGTQEWLSLGEHAQDGSTFVWCRGEMG